MIHRSCKAGQSRGQTVRSNSAAALRIAISVAIDFRGGYELGGTSEFLNSLCSPQVRQMPVLVGPFGVAIAHRCGCVGGSKSDFMAPPHGPEQ